VAVSIQDRQFGLDQLSPHRIAEPSVHDLASRVRVIEEGALTKEFPEKTISIFEIVLKGGRVLTDRTEAAKGDPRNPMSEEDFIEKFMALTASRMEEKAKLQMRSLIMDLENVSNVEAVVRLAG
jgi:2-methylcitrate dehydratase PrpD